MPEKKPIYKRTWFIVLVVLIVIGTISSQIKKKEAKKAEELQTTKDKLAEYTKVDVNELVSELDNNALNAQQLYKDKYLEITGPLSTIDSDGKYFSIRPSGRVFGVQCYIKDKEQLNYLATLSKGEYITVRVRITDVGEIIGYQADVIEFVK